MPLTTIQSGMMDSVAQYYGFKNRIINGAMGISQRGTSFTASTVSATYTLDRWLVIPTGANVTVAQVAGIGGFQNALQITGAASNTQVYASQRIESANIADLAGTTVTLSAVMQASTNNTVQWAAYYPNAKDNYSSSTFIALGTFNVTTSAQTFSAQINLPAQAANGLWVLFYPNNTGAFTSGTLTITGVQLEEGSTATSFDYRPYTTELQLCQRYYWSWSTSQFTRLAIGFNDTTTSTQIPIFLPVPLRATPSLGLTNMTSSGIAITGSGVSVSNTGVWITAAGTGLTVGATQIYTAASSTGVVALSAEL